MLISLMKNLALQKMGPPDYPIWEESSHTEKHTKRSQPKPWLLLHTH